MITIYVKRIRSYMHGFLRYRNNKVKVKVKVNFWSVRGTVKFNIICYKFRKLTFLFEHDVILKHVLLLPLLSLPCLLDVRSFLS